MSDQGLRELLSTEATYEQQHRFESGFPSERAPEQRFASPLPPVRDDDELAACAHAPGWDESGFPLARRSRSLPALVWRLFDR